MAWTRPLSTLYGNIQNWYVNPVVCARITVMLSLPGHHQQQQQSESSKPFAGKYVRSESRWMAKLRPDTNSYAYPNV